MCDTIVAVKNATKDGSVVFGKNSDREPNEAHNILYIPRQNHEVDEQVKCTYINVPQVEETFEVLLLKPFWMFGCEMGTNEYGVTIGNEAVWSKEPYRKSGLLGMDLMRLALERSNTAEGALNVIIDLIDEFGQGGACGYTDKKLFYHNSYIIADPEDAWVLETADKYWIAEKVKNIRTISNTLTIGNDYDKIHPELIDHAIKEGYCKNKDEFHFADNFIPRFNIKQIGAKGKKRIACTTSILEKAIGKITPKIMMRALRNHNVSPSAFNEWAPYKSSMSSPCMHYTSFITPSQSVGSHVAHLRKELQIHWVTGTSAPCTGIFKPIFFPNIGFQAEYQKASKYYNSGALWWQHEKLHRLTLLDYQKRINVYRQERNEFEEELFSNVEKVSNQTKPDFDVEKMKTLSENAFEKAKELTETWIKKIEGMEIQSRPKKRYLKRWNKLNRHDKLDLDFRV